MSTTPIRLGDLLAQLPPRPTAPQPIPAALADPLDADNSPWYIKGLVGIAAWIAALFIGVFLGLTGWWAIPNAMLQLGIILTVGAIVLKRLLPRSIFWGQLTFAAILTGQGLLISDFYWRSFSDELTWFGFITVVDVWYKGMGATALFVIVLELFIFALYPDALHRMLSIFAITTAVLVLIYIHEQPDWIHGVTFVLALGAVLSWQQELRLLASRWHPFRAPLGYGLALALFGVCLFSLDDLSLLPTQWWLSAVGFTILLLYLVFTLLQELGRPIVSPVGLWALGAVALLLIPAYQTPGILAAIIVLLLSHWRHNGLLMGLATVFLLFFLGVYYYYLDITLLNKSYILMGTGAILLVLRFLFHQVAGQQHGDLEA